MLEEIANFMIDRSTEITQPKKQKKKEIEDKWTEEVRLKNGRVRSLAILMSKNQWWKWTEFSKTTILGLWKLTKGTQQSDKHLLKINTWTLGKNNRSLWHFSLGILSSHPISPNSLSSIGIVVLPGQDKMWKPEALLSERVDLNWTVVLKKMNVPGNCSWEMVANEQGRAI